MPPGAAFGVCAAALTAVFSVSWAAAGSVAKPHILLLYIDDWGWADVGYHRKTVFESDPPEIRTPTIDRLVAEGVELDRVYAYSFCSPSRAAMLSGRLPHNVWGQNIRSCSYNPEHPEIGGEGIPRNMTTSSQLLKKAGYSTHFVDVGFATAGHIPRGRGFDTALGYFFQINDYWTQGMSGSEGAGCARPHLVDFWHDDAPAVGLNGSDYEEALFEREMISVINDFASASTNQPFFLYYAPHLVHSPYQVPGPWLARYNYIGNKSNADPGGLRQVYASMVGYLDTVLANVTDALRDRGMWDNTFVLCASDNGGPIQGGQGANNWPLRGGKLTHWDGGLRVNSFASGGFLPSSVRGTIIKALIHTCDFWATLADAAGVPAIDPAAAAAGLPSPDSISIWPLLTGVNASAPRTELLLNGIFYAGDGVHLLYKLKPGSEGNAIHTGPFYPNASTDFKSNSNTIIDCSNASQGGDPEVGACLFDLLKDPGESNNLARTQQDRAIEMSARASMLSKRIAGINNAWRGRGLDERACAQIDRNGGFWYATSTSGYYTVVKSMQSV